MSELKRGYTNSAEAVLNQFSAQFPSEAKDDPIFLFRMQSCLAFAQRLMLLDDSGSLAASAGDTTGMEPWPIIPWDYLNIIASPTKRSEIGLVYEIPEEPRELPGFRTATIALIFDLNPQDVDLSTWLEYTKDKNELREILHTALTHDIAELENQMFHLQGLITAQRIEIPNRADGYQILLYASGRKLIDFYRQMKDKLTQRGVISLDILRF